MTSRDAPPERCRFCGKGLYWCVQEVGERAGQLRVHCEDAQHCGVLIGFVPDTPENRARAGAWLTDSRANRAPRLDGRPLKKGPRP